MRRFVNWAIVAVAAFIIGYVIFGPNDPDVETGWKGQTEKWNEAWRSLAEGLRDENFTRVSAHDAEINEAIARARRELPQFIAKLDAADAEALKLRLKGGFPTRGGGVE